MIIYILHHKTLKLGSGVTGRQILPCGSWTVLRISGIVDSVRSVLPLIWPICHYRVERAQPDRGRVLDDIGKIIDR